jgi:hypothetical protein
MSAAPAITLWGLVAEFDTHEDLVTAVRHVREAGYRHVDAYSPYPIDGLAGAIGFHRAGTVALITLVGGLVGAIGGYVMQYYLMAVDYPIDVGGRPLHSWPAFVPVTFELMVLSASLFATIGLFVLNGLPRPHHPLFAVRRFAHATQDGFFLSIAAGDPRFDRDAAWRLVDRLGAVYISEVADE